MLMCLVIGSRPLQGVPDLSPKSVERDSNSPMTRKRTSALENGWLSVIVLSLIFGVLANMSDKKAVIKNADMSEEMQQDAVDCAMQAMEKYNIEKDIAAYVKKVSTDQYRFLK